MLLPHRLFGCHFCYLIETNLFFTFSGHLFGSFFLRVALFYIAYFLFFSFNNNKQIKILENRIHSVENKIKELVAETFKEDVFTNYSIINKINEEIKELREELKNIDKEYYELLNL